MNSVNEIIISTTGYSLFARILLSMLAMSTAGLSRKFSSLHTVCSGSSNGCLKAMRVECECPVVMYLVTLPALQCSCRTSCEVAIGEGDAGKDRSGNVTDNGRKHLWASESGCLAFSTLKLINTYPNVTASL